MTDQTPDLGPGTLQEMYAQRFAAQGLEERIGVWRILCAEWFQRFVAANATILDVGAGYGEFINHIRGAKRYALDANADVAKYVQDDVEVLSSQDARHIPLETGSVDVAFTSNFFEHLPEREDVLTVLAELRRVLKPGETFMIIQPNIKYLYQHYWDFFDHRIPLSHESMAEALGIVGFTVQRCQAKFLPYSFKSRLPKADFLVRWYLKFPPAQWILGKQMFIVASAPRST